MKILALDTATEACSAAVLIDNKVIERFVIAPRQQGALVMPMISAVLEEAGLRCAQLDALAFGRGPGAFTGVRIACAVAQGIAFAADLPVAPISTLAAIARGAGDAHGVEQVAVAIDARMGEIYWGTYRLGGDGGVALSGQECLCRPAAALLIEGGDWAGAGSGWAVHSEALQHLGIKQWWADCYPRAAVIARLGTLAYRSGALVSPEQALPVYLRDEVAQRLR